MEQRSVKLILSRVVCFAGPYCVVAVCVANNGLVEAEAAHGEKVEDDVATLGVLRQAPPGVLRPWTSALFI